MVNAIKIFALLTLNLDTNLQSLIMS